MDNKLNHMLYEIEYWNIVNETMGQLHMLGNNFGDILVNTDYYLDRLAGENNWEILKIESLPGIAIVNLEDYVAENSEGQSHFDWEPKDIECPSCAVEHTVLDNLIKFNCNQCGFEMVLADNGWSAIRCSACENKIERSSLIRDSKTGDWKYKEEI